ncbi:MAG: hypothetical protein ACD_54C00180G0002 [uncultured bacterium]|nr:MAG: hypothetical protein ACD_54C00180G0002 [uncultured bacterium]
MQEPRLIVALCADVIVTVAALMGLAVVSGVIERVFILWRRIIAAVRAGQAKVDPQRAEEHEEIGKDCGVHRKYS